MTIFSALALELELRTVCLTFAHRLRHHNAGCLPLRKAMKMQLLSSARATNCNKFCTVNVYSRSVVLLL